MVWVVMHLLTMLTISLAICIWFSHVRTSQSQPLTSTSSVTSTSMRIVQQQVWQPYRILSSSCSIRLVRWIHVRMRLSLSLFSLISYKSSSKHILVMRHVLPIVLLVTFQKQRQKSWFFAILVLSRVKVGLWRQLFSQWTSRHLHLLSNVLSRRKQKVVWQRLRFPLLISRNFLSVSKLLWRWCVESWSVVILMYCVRKSILLIP